ncbi:hypothetical protein ACTXT7_005872 [Hymenolepis weldensis]
MIVRMSRNCRFNHQAAWGQHLRCGDRKEHLGSRAQTRIMKLSYPKRACGPRRRTMTRKNDQDITPMYY